jgi:hypothetical protein
MELGVLSVRIESDDATGNSDRYIGLPSLNKDAASFEAYGPSFAPIGSGSSPLDEYASNKFGKALDFVKAASDTGKSISEILKISNDFIATYQPPDLSEITVLPHKKHLVPKHQAAKQREQLKVWGLRK